MQIQHPKDTPPAGIAVEQCVRGEVYTTSGQYYLACAEAGTVGRETTTFVVNLRTGIRVRANSCGSSRFIHVPDAKLLLA